jgi:hypothetical protein
MKLSITKAIRLTKVRKNGWQKCCWCSEPMIEGTHNISLGCQKRLNHYNIWLHVDCADAFLKHMKKKLPVMRIRVAGEML